MSLVSLCHSPHGYVFALALQRVQRAEPYPGRDLPNRRAASYTCASAGRPGA